MKLSDAGAGLKARQRRIGGGCRVKPPAPLPELPVDRLTFDQLLARYLASESGSPEASHYAAALRARSQLLPSLN